MLPKPVHVLLLLAATLPSLLAPAAVQAAAPGGLTLRDAGPLGGIVRTDGRRSIASAQPRYGAAVTVLDTATGRRSTVVSPHDCALADLHAGTLLWDCRGAYGYTTAATLTLATGARATLPAPPHDPASADGTSYEAIGTRWARVRFSSYHTSTAGWISRATGHLVTADPGASFVPDLDSPALMRPLCSGVTRPTVPDVSGLTVTLTEDLAQAGPWAASTTYDDIESPPGVVQLQHCDRPPRTLTTCRRVQCSQPVITKDFVAWTENGRHGRLVVRSLATGRTRSVSRLTPLTPLLAGRRLYVAAAGRLLRVAL